MANRPLAWGLIGGGAGSQIGRPHRIAAGLDNLFALQAGALDVDPAKGRDFAASLGIEPARAYGSWQEMLAAEAARADRLSLITVATPNATHYAISRALLEAGFDVLCEKPLAMSVDEAMRLEAVAAERGRLLAVNFGYSGYPMVRQARAMVRAGELGRIRLVVAEFAHGFHADGADADNPRLRWRYDPAQAGVSSVLADAGIHALHMASYIACQSVTRVAADFVSSIEGRQLEDDALLALRFDKGAVGRLWTSAIAIGQMHGLNIRIFGEKAGLRWHQEFPNQLYVSPLNGATSIVERGSPGLHPEAEAASRVAIGHAEGMLGAFANLYRDLHAAILARQNGQAAPSLDSLPLAQDGVDTLKVIHAAARSAKEDGAWIEI